MPIMLIHEGRADEALLRQVLADELATHHIRLYAVGTRSSAISSATTALSVRRWPVVVVVDGDADAPAEARYEVERALSSAALGLPYRVVAIPTSLEHWLASVQAAEEQLPGDGRNGSAAGAGAGRRRSLNGVQFSPRCVAALRDSAVGRELVSAVRELVAAAAQPA